MKKYLLALLFLLPIILFAAGNDDTITVTKVQPQFTISLAGNATTGYAWAPTTYDGRLVELLSSDYVANPNKKLMGAPGTFVFTFKARSVAFSMPQSTPITFVYSRPWITDKTGVVQVQYTVSTMQ